MTLLSLDSRWMLHPARAVLPRFVIIPSRHSDHQAWYSEPNILAPTNPTPSSPLTCPALFQTEGDSNCPVPRHTAHPQTTNLCTPTTQGECFACNVEWCKSDVTSSSAGFLPPPRPKRPLCPGILVSPLLPTPMECRSARKR